MEASELIVVYTAKDPNEAEIIHNALQAEGIASFIEGEHQAGLSGIFDVKVLVPAIDADRARKLIETHGK